MPSLKPFFSFFKLYPSFDLLRIFNYYSSIFFRFLVTKIEEKIHMKISILFDALAVGSLLLTLLKIYVYLVFNVQILPLINILLLIIFFFLSLKFNLIVILRELLISIFKESFALYPFIRFMVAPIKHYWIQYQHEMELLPQFDIKFNIKNFLRLFKFDKESERLYMGFNAPFSYFRAAIEENFKGFLLAFFVLSRLIILAEPILFIIVNFIFYFFLLFNKFLLFAFLYSLFLSCSRIIFLAFDHSVSNMYNKLNKWSFGNEFGSKTIKITKKNIAIIGLWLITGLKLHECCIVNTDKSKEWESNERNKMEGYKLEKDVRIYKTDMMIREEKADKVKHLLYREKGYFQQNLYIYNDLLSYIKEQKNKYADTEPHDIRTEGEKDNLYFTAYLDKELISKRGRVIKEDYGAEYYDINVEGEKDIISLKGYENFELIAIKVKVNKNGKIEQQEIKITEKGEEFKQFLEENKEYKITSIKIIVRKKENLAHGGYFYLYDTQIDIETQSFNLYLFKGIISILLLYIYWKNGIMIVETL